MMYPHIIHRILMEEIMEFRRLGLNPNKLVISDATLHHMFDWPDIQKYYIPSEQAQDGRARYYGLTVVNAYHPPKQNSYETAFCFVCCAAEAGKVKGIV